ncbi:MAG: tRNA (adenosine(37)-N6)-threonylcarbamoyltransferase complex transferase subunit TsaD [Verrucomicrobia bacterium]|nr:MAG: tRNA (adenosine(37)-N6)-threonylcarbamoyltransferase complex transferase subunit TsaD [Verrucomicrobiota bacterium]
MNSKTVLALETSCDETAVAILRGAELLASEVASQIAEHEKFGGVVPEVAARNHLVHAPRLLERALRAARIDISKVDAFAATSGPGLASSLMIGASIAKGLAIGFGKSYLAINHLEGHLLSPFFAQAKIRPNVSLIVSGGHTMTMVVRGVANYELIGRTVDDAAGEAFDKVAKLLGLGYPGGPEIEKHAVRGDPTRFDLPRSMLDSENSSFSGLKTAVRYLLPKLSGDYLADLCASFQQAVIDVLVQKTIAAAKSYDVDLVTMSGGVSCNQELRRQLHEACSRERLQLQSAEPWLCTDNAAMIAFAASLRLQHGFESSVTEEIDPSLALR